MENCHKSYQSSFVDAEEGKLYKYLILEIFSQHIFKHIKHQSGQSWKTKIYRPEDLRPGPFSIHQDIH